MYAAASACTTSNHRRFRDGSLGLDGGRRHALEPERDVPILTCGVPLKAVQDLMGHATIEMTMRYAHLSPHVPRDAVKLLDHGGRLGNGWAKTENRT
jgi:integrase